MCVFFLFAVNSNTFVCTSSCSGVNKSVSWSIASYIPYISYLSNGIYMFCMFAIIAVLSAECKCFFPISKKNHKFFWIQENFRRKSAILLLFMRILCDFFPHFSQEFVFSKKRLPCWHAALTSLYTANQIFASTRCVSSWLAPQSILQYLHRVGWLSVTEILFCASTKRGTVFYEK